MKKLLIATAALAMVAGTAQAQSSVTVYGIIDTGYNSLETTTAAGLSTKVSAISTNGEAATSRLGFRGTEDLGGGMKANFQIESTIGQTGLATGTVMGSRAFWVGLEDAKMGQVRIGLQDAFTRSVWLGADQLAAANVIGNLAHDNGTPMTGGTALAPTGAATTSHTTRFNAVNYLSPRVNGVQFMLGVMQNNTEATTKVKTGSGTQVGVNYTAGNFTAAAAYAEATTDTNAAPTEPVAANTASVKTKDTAIGLTYDLKVAKLGYIYNKRENVNSVNPVLAANNSDRTSHSFSASIPLSANLTGRVGYGFGNYAVATGSAAGVDRDIKGYQAALNYNLSKRTMVYGIYGDEKRETSATQNVKAKEYSVGVRHSF